MPLHAVMRFLVLVLLFLIPTVQAQPPVASEAGTPERIGGARRVAVASAGIVGGTVAGVGTGVILFSSVDTLLGAPLVLVAIPIGATLMMQAVGDAVGAEAPALAVARDVMLGAGAGALLLAAGTGLGTLVEIVVFENNDYVIFGPLIGGFVGGLVGTGLFVKLSTRSFRMAPAALAAPTGERAPGLSLRLAL